MSENIHKEQTMEKAPAITPQQYHLTEGQKYRDQIIKEIGDWDEQGEKRRKDRLAGLLKDSGIVLPKSFRKESDSGYGDYVVYKTPKYRVTIRLDREHRNLPEPERIKKIREHRKVICSTFTATAANRFAGYVKLRYGKEASLATIKKAHAEWLDLLACQC